MFFFPKSPLHVRFSFFFSTIFPQNPPLSPGGRFPVPPKCLCSPLVILFCSFQVHVIINIPTDKIFYLFFFFWILHLGIWKKKPCWPCKCVSEKKNGPNLANWYACKMKEYKTKLLPKIMWTEYPASFCLEKYFRMREKTL